MWQNILLKKPAEKLSIALYHPHPPRNTTIHLGQHSSFQAEHVSNRDPNGQAFSKNIRPADPSFPHFGRNEDLLHLVSRTPPPPIIGQHTYAPSLRFRHAPAVGMLNHLIWFLESRSTRTKTNNATIFQARTFYTRIHRPARKNHGGRRHVMGTYHIILPRLLCHRDAAASRLRSTFLTLDNNGPHDFRRQPGPKIVCADLADNNDGKISERHHPVCEVTERSKNRSDDPLKTGRQHSPTHTDKLPSASHRPKTWTGKY
jgi:hypothetical protein